MRIMIIPAKMLHEIRTIVGPRICNVPIALQMLRTETEGDHDNIVQKVLGHAATMHGLDTSILPLNL